MSEPILQSWPSWQHLLDWAISYLQTCVPLLLWLTWRVNCQTSRNNSKILIKTKLNNAKLHSIFVAYIYKFLWLAFTFLHPFQWKIYFHYPPTLAKLSGIRCLIFWKIIVWKMHFSCIANLNFRSNLLLKNIKLYDI